MYLKQLKLTNIRSYKSETINFPKGSVLLSGDIGAGKSTILHAIEFALFGLRRKHLTGPALLRNGAKLGEVELNFMLQDKDITIKRTLKKLRDKVEQVSGYIIINNQKQELTAIELKAKVLELLGYPMDLLNKSKNLIYTYTVYTPQDEMKEILTEEPDLRLDVLRKVFGFSKYKTIRENCTIALKEIKSKIKVYEGSTADLVEKTRISKQLSEQITLLKTALAETDIKLSQIKQDIEKKTTDLTIMEEQKLQVQDLKKNIVGCNARLEEMLNSKKRLQEQIDATVQEILLLQIRSKDAELTKPEGDAESIEFELRAKEASIYRIINEEESIKSKLHLYESSLGILGRELSELSKSSELVLVKQSQIELLKAELDKKELMLNTKKQKEQKLAELNNAIQELNVKKRTSQETVDKVSKLNNCPLCLQEVKHEHKDQIYAAETGKVFAWNEELNKLYADKSMEDIESTHLAEALDALSEKEKELNRLKVEVSMLELGAKQLVAKAKQEAEYNAKVAELNERLKQVQKNNVIDLQQAVEVLKHKLKLWQQYQQAQAAMQEYKRRLESLAMLKSRQIEQESGLTKEILILESKSKDYFEKLENYRELDMRFRIAKEEYEALNKIEKDYLMKQASQAKEISGIEKQLKELNFELERKEKEKAEMNRFGQTENWLEKSFIPLTVVIERQIMIHVYKLFDELFRKWLSMLVEDGMLNVRLDQDFTPVIEQNGFDVEYEHLSGGEKTSIALAYRLALNKVVNDLYHGIATHDLIILDEPTDGFSREHLDKLREVFDELHMKQLVIVSHESKIESFVENVIRVSKNEHVSAVFC